MTLSDDATSNVIDVVCDGLGTPKLIQINSLQFSTKYNIKIASYICIAWETYNEGDVVLVAHQRKYYLCNYNDNILKDLMNDKVIEEVKGTKILGMVYSCTYYF